MKEAIDLYFDENYGKLYEKVEKGKQEIFNFESENGKISSQFIIREIPEKVDGKAYYDIVTPYGYGGPVIEKVTGEKEKLVSEFEKVFSNYCVQHDIVSEFIRFHPIVKNALDFENIYSPIYMRKTLITKLDEEEVFQKQFSKNARKTVRQDLNRGVSYSVIEAPEDLDAFKELYYITMDRNTATDYYYFGNEYFDDLLKYYGKNIILLNAFFEEKLIASMLCFVYNGIIHVHLSGTLNEYLYLAPTYVLKYAMVEWGIKNGYKLIHHGGGRSNSLEDNLYLFKRNFARLYDLDFYIGKKIWNKEIYDKLCEIKKVKDDGFFPAYRK